MAIMFVRAQVIGRGAGRSVVSAAAYRHRTRMMDERVGTQFRYEDGAAELVHEELALPAEKPAWLCRAIDGRSVGGASEALWNAVEAFETRVDAQLAREMIFALPEELSRKENIALVREFIEQNLTRQGMVADWVYHDKDGNPHVHVMTTLRPLTEDGFGGKKVAVMGEDGSPLRVVTPDRPKGKIVYRLWAGDAETMKGWKLAWAETANRHLALAGHDIRIDGRSYEEQGLEGLAGRHFGPARAALKRDGRLTFSAPAEMARRFAVADQIAADPGILLKQLSGERSTFDERDIARALHRHIDDPTTFANVRAGLMASSDLVTLRPAEREPGTAKVLAPAVFTTKHMLRTEFEMARSADALSKRGGFAVSNRTVGRAIAEVETRDSDRPFRFDEEQVDAVRHVTGKAAIAAVVGLAGAGKSTLLDAARIAWEADGRRVIGAALAGKAAESLEQSSGIASRTLASWERSWSNGRDLLGKGDVLVIDEAGMIASEQMSRFLKIAEEAQAKVVLVGDAMQLQPIQAGAAFRAVAARVGHAELSGVRRQREDWAREATRAFARGDVEDGLAHYSARGHVVETDTRENAVARIVADWSSAWDEAKAKAAREDRPLVGDALLVLAHTNDDVKALNAAIRNVRIEQEELTASRTFATERGARDFAVGDRMIFLENARFVEPIVQHLGLQSVKNGMLGTVLSTVNDKRADFLTVRLDSGRDVAFSTDTYRNIDHGYAATVHKSQGATVDRTFVLATGGMDKHLTYVAMSRHRERADLYAATEDFPAAAVRGRTQRPDHAAGVTGILIDTGMAKFRDDPDVEPSPYADLKLPDGRSNRLWGVSLPDALDGEGVDIGDTVTLTKNGTETVMRTVPIIDEETGVKRFEERAVERNVWSAVLVERGSEDVDLSMDADVVVHPKIFRPLVDRLGRSGEKTTTLDFEHEETYRALIRDYADRRGVDQVIDLARHVEDGIRVQVKRFSVGSEQVPGASAVVSSLGSGSSASASATATIGGPGASGVVAAVSAKGSPEGEGAEMTEGAAYLLAPVIRFEQSVEDDARAAQRAASAWKEREAVLLPLLAQLYVEPEAALARLGDKATRPETDPRVFGERIAAMPVMLGAVRTDVASKERASVVADLAVSARALATAFRADEGRFIAREERWRGHMAIGVPALSDATVARLDEIEAIGRAGGMGAYRTAFMFATEDRRTVQEIKAVAEALTARFGWSAFTDKADETSKRIVAEHMPDMPEADRTKLEQRFTAVRRFAAEQHYAEKRDPSRIVAAAAHDPVSHPDAVGPAALLLPAVTAFPASAEEEARTRVPVSPLYRAERDALAAVATRIWRDPQAAVLAIEEKVRAGASPAALQNDMAARPATFGALLGSDRLVDRLTGQGRERKMAVAGAKYEAWKARSLAQAFATVVTSETKAIESERSRMGVPVPGLSRDAEAELKRLVALVSRQPKDFDGAVLALAPTIKAEFAAVSKALDARFGRGAIGRNEKTVIAMVPSAQQGAFKTIQPQLRTIQRAVAADIGHAIASERRLRAIDQARGIDR
ncbi:MULTISPECIES: Ti-type conjugative transfer relaxase TraA [unclassified Aureimonas]|uniref:Ti-type conjugative transfer relaxase TraA n=1 Tax=unclassified Aureimonas TaxID=2615206 RepID=UPI0006F9A0AD|nr:MULTISPECIES: Ti-type conjugative transfer relaxase TraA [unclassified Aureimonas]KQT63301.1 conjugal transfer protein TraA [Aureimonas sp. Leaf427]KQT80119.1 conjugal transfer protein TraA [Aureimonas sp. Leaf460]